jgi:hypothetical protein
VKLDLKAAPVVPAEQVQRYLYDIHLTLFQARFSYYSFDVKQAWEDGIRQWWEGRHSPLVDILGPVKDALRWFWDNILRPPLEALLSGLRWALEKAIGAVRWAVDGIASTLGSVWDYLRGLGSWIWAQVSGGLSWLWDRVQAGISWVWGKVQEGLSWLWDQARAGFEAVKGGLSWLWSELKSGLEWVYKGIAAMMSGVAEYIVSGLRGLLSIFEKIGEWIWNALKAGAEWIWDHLIKPVAEGIAKIWEAIVGAIAHAVYRWGHQEPEGAFERAMTVWAAGTALYFAARTGAQAVEAAYPTKELHLDEYVLRAAEIGGLFAFGHTMYTTIYDAAVKVPLRYEVMSRFTPSVPDERTILEMLSRYRIKPEEAHRLMRYHGYDERWDPWWDELANTPLSPTMLRYGAYGGTLTEDFLERELRRRGISEEAVAQFKKSFRFWADSQDIRDCQSQIRSLVKEGFITAQEARDTYAAFRAIEDPLERQIFVAQLAYLYDYLLDRRSLVLERYRRKKLTRSEALAQLTEFMGAREKAELLLDLTAAKAKLEEELAAS